MEWEAEDQGKPKLEIPQPTVPAWTSQEFLGSLRTESLPAPFPKPPGPRLGLKFIPEAVRAACFPRTCGDSMAQWAEGGEGVHKAGWEQDLERAQWPGLPPVVWARAQASSPQARCPQLRAPCSFTSQALGQGPSHFYWLESRVCGYTLPLWMSLVIPESTLQSGHTPSPRRRMPRACWPPSPHHQGFPNWCWTPGWTRSQPCRGRSGPAWKVTVGYVGDVISQAGPLCHCPCQSLLLLESGVFSHLA